jgi:hypothetical protein
MRIARVHTSHGTAVVRHLSHEWYRQMRRRIWNWINRHHEEGTLLPTWKIVVRFFFFPIEGICYVFSDRFDYDARAGVLKIDGALISVGSLRALSDRKGWRTIKIKREGNMIYCKDVRDGERAT